jgi:hypothetical protein
MNLEPDPNGTWRVIGADGEILASGLTHAQAWEFVDRHDDEGAELEETIGRIGRAYGQT